MTNKNIEIYTASYCPFCTKAKDLLDRKKLKYKEIDVEGNDEARKMLAERSGGRKTIPQIFIDNKHIGGCDELYELEITGELDELLKLV